MLSIPLPERAGSLVLVLFCSTRLQPQEGARGRANSTSAPMLWEGRGAGNHIIFAYLITSQDGFGHWSEAVSGQGLWF